MVKVINFFGFLTFFTLFLDIRLSETVYAYKIALLFWILDFAINSRKITKDSYWLILLILLESSSFILNRSHATVLGYISQLLSPMWFYLLGALAARNHSIIRACLSTFIVTLIIGYLGLIFANPYFGLGYGMNLEVLTGNYFANVRFQDVGGSVSLGRLRFSFADPNSMAMSVVFVMAIQNAHEYIFGPLYSRMKQRFLVLFFLLTIILSGSRTGLLAFAILLLIQERRVLIGILPVFFGAGILVGMFLINNGSAIQSLERLQDYTGNGTGNGRFFRWSYHLARIDLKVLSIGNSWAGDINGDFKSAHNDFISRIYKGGLMSLLAYLMLLFKLASKFRFTVVLIILFMGMSQEIAFSRTPLALLSFLFSYTFTTGSYPPIVQRIHCSRDPQLG